MDELLNDDDCEDDDYEHVGGWRGNPEKDKTTTKETASDTFDTAHTCIPHFPTCALQWSSSERKRTPNIYAMLSQKLVMSRFTCFLKGFRLAFSESHPACRELSTKVSLLSEGFQRMSSFREPFENET